MKQKISKVLLVLMFCMILAPFSQADDQVKVEVNGVLLKLDVAPVVINDRTMVPLRAIFEALGATVSWDGSTNTITGIKGEKKIVLQIDNKMATVDGKQVELDVPATLINDRTMVPARFVAESFGADVKWDGATSTVKITLSYTPEGIIYKSETGPAYRVYTNKSIDTFLIAAGLYSGFNNQYILPHADERDLYKKVKSYFSPYKDHAFIKDFAKYMDSSGDVNSSYMVSLLNYTAVPELKPVYDTSSSPIVKSKTEQEFLSGLRAFYNDTKAEAFFKSNEDSYQTLGKYITDNIEKSSILKLIPQVESYTGNKEKYYSGKKVVYCTVLSFYRSVGSFYTLNSGNELNLVSIQMPYKQAYGSNDFSINNIMDTSIHEYLHNYVNAPVANQMTLINSLTAGKNKADYISSMYVAKNFAWNRISDECFVRAIEARLFKVEFGEARALDDIINPDIKYGFLKLRSVYDKLDEYEKQRQSYPMIDDFMPELLKTMYK